MLGVMIFEKYSDSVVIADLPCNSNDWFIYFRDWNAFRNWRRNYRVSPARRSRRTRASIRGTRKLVSAFPAENVAVLLDQVRPICNRLTDRVNGTRECGRRKHQSWNVYSVVRGENSWDSATATACWSHPPCTHSLVHQGSANLVVRAI